MAKTYDSLENLEGAALSNFGHEVQLAGALYAGNGRSFLLVFPDEGEVPYPGPLTHLSREDWDRVLRQTDLLEVQALVKGEGDVVHKAIVRKSQRQVDQVASWEVFRRDGYRCRYCGADKVPLTVDHLVLWEEGGPSTPENMLACCRKDNKTRGRTPYAEWLRSSYYKRVSEKLPFAVREDNERLVETLDAIPRVYVRSR